MIVHSEYELEKLRQASKVAALTLKELLLAVKPGITTMSLDKLGADIIADHKAKSAPKYFYGFPASICICTGSEVAHGRPGSKIIAEDDLVNIDVSVVLDGYVSDNGASVYFGQDKNIQKLCTVSRNALARAMDSLEPGMKVNEIGRAIEKEALRNNFTVIKNLCGHGVGKKIHEAPEIPNYHDIFNRKTLKDGDVIALETFVSTKSEYVTEKGDKWTWVCEKGEYVAQYEHTIHVTRHGIEVLTQDNGI